MSIPLDLSPDEEDVTIVFTGVNIVNESGDVISEFSTNFLLAVLIQEIHKVSNLLQSDVRNL